MLNRSGIFWEGALMFFWENFRALGPAAIRRRYRKDIDKHPYIKYKGYIPDLTNDILFGKIPMNLEKYSYFVIMFYENIQGFWGYFVMVLNNIYIKGLSNMSNLYVFAPGPSFTPGRWNKLRPNPHLLI
jgi:hypothetical protein